MGKTALVVVDGYRRLAAGARPTQSEVNSAAGAALQKFKLPARNLTLQRVTGGQHFGCNVIQWCTLTGSTSVVDLQRSFGES
jgi:hypothetical protein